MSQSQADLFRRIENICFEGEIVDYKYEKGIHWGRVKRTVDDKNSFTTRFIAMREERAGKNRSSSPFELGEQIVVISPSGEPDNGYIAFAVPQEAYPAATDNPDDTGTRYKDGAFIHYNRKEHILFLDMPDGAEIKINNATVKITNGDVIADGVSLKHHKNKGVKKGIDLSGEPES